MFAYPLPAALVAISTLLALAALAEAARRSPWAGAAVGQHVWLMATVAVLIGQQMSLALDSGLQVQYLGSAFLALLVGYPRALLSMALILLISPFAGSMPEGLSASDSLNSWGLRLLVCGLIPIWAMWLIVQLSKRRLPRNLFVFLLGCGLFGLMLSYALQLLTSAGLYTLLNTDPASDFFDAFLPYAFLLASGESWLEGMIITVLVVYVPGAVTLFDEAHYLRRA